MKYKTKLILIAFTIALTLFFICLAHSLESKVAMEKESDNTMASDKVMAVAKGIEIPKIEIEKPKNQNPKLETEQNESTFEEYYEPYVEQTYYQYYSDEASNFMRDGVRYDDNGTRYTYYSSNVAYHYRTSEWTPNENGMYETSDGYLVVASSDYPQGTIIDTPWGQAQVLDSGCSSGTVDMYVNY